MAQELAGGVRARACSGSSRRRCPGRACRTVVAHTLVVAGLPMDMGPFFWAQAQPGRPVPTLAELAAERGVQPAAGRGLVPGDGQ